MLIERLSHLFNYHQEFCSGGRNPQIIYLHVELWIYKVDIHYILVSRYCSARGKTPLPHIT